MKEIGKVLQEKRIAAGLEIDAISAKTRLTPKHIKALEEGDISFFHDDLSYVRFFVKSYCEVVGADFDELKDDLRKCIDSYTTDIVVGKQNEVEQKNRKIVSNIKEHKPKVSVGETSLKHKKSTDTGFITLIAVFVVVAALLGGAAFMLLSKGDKQPNKQDDLPIAEVEKDDANKENNQTQNGNVDKDENKEENKEVKEMSITMKTPTSYVIDHVKEGEPLKIETTFNGSSSGYSVTINGKEVKTEGVYQFQETAKTEVKVEKGMKASLYIGCMVNVDIKVNGKVVKTDESINPAVFPGACPSQTIDFEIGALN